jgi:hypothetical protein
MELYGPAGRRAVRIRSHFVASPDRARRASAACRIAAGWRLLGGQRGEIYARDQVSREAWSARSSQPVGFVRHEHPMNAPPDASAATGTAAAASPVVVPAPPSLPWRRGALILAGAAQLITISALTSADPLAVTWSALLLAITPAPLAAAAAFAPAPVDRLARHRAWRPDRRCCVLSAAPGAGRHVARELGWPPRSCLVRLAPGYIARRCR